MNLRSSHHNLKNITFDYLIENWYRKDKRCLWGRRQEQKVALTRTTMRVDDHWSFSRRCFLLQFNRLRADLLIHIIVRKLVPKMQNDFEAYKVGRRKPAWFKSFVLERKRCCNSKNCRFSYNTNGKIFICSYPAWQRAQFCLCKHLVDERPCPTYKELVILRCLSFIEIQLNSARAIANIDDKDVINLSQELSLQTDQTQPLKESSSSNVHEEQMSGAKEILGLTSWLEGLVQYISSVASRYAQLSHIHNRIITSLIGHKRDVERSMSRRIAPKTWSSSKTVFFQWTYFL